MFGNKEDKHALIKVEVGPNKKEKIDNLIIYMKKVSHRGVLVLWVELELILVKNSLLGLASRAVGLQVSRKEMVPTLGLPKTLWEEVMRWAGAMETPERTGEPEDFLTAPLLALGLGGPE